MIQKLADGDARIRQLGNVLPDAVIVVQLPFFFQDHDCHGGEHFRHRSELESRGNRQSFFSLKIIITISLFENQPPFFPVQDASVKTVFGLHRAEDAVDDPGFLSHGYLIEIDKDAIDRKRVAFDVPGRFFYLLGQVKNANN